MNDVIIKEENLPAIDDSFMSEMTRTHFLPYLMLKVASSSECKDGSFPVNHYAIKSAGVLVDLGASVDVIVLAVRPKAVDFTSGVKAFYNFASPAFKAVAQRSQVKDSKCQYGPEFLLWLSEEEQFVTFMMGSISARNVSPELNALRGKGASLGAQGVKTEKYSWFVPTITPCNTPLTPIGENYNQVLSDFLNPVEPVLEPAPEVRMR